MHKTADQSEIKKKLKGLDCRIILAKDSISEFNSMYRKVASSNTPHLEAHEGFFRLLDKGFL